MRSAYLDIGSNSIRYLAAETGRDGTFRILDRGLETPRLGAGAGKDGLEAAARERALAALAKIVGRLRSLGVDRFRAVGTEALRRAPNRSSFLRGAAELGLAVEVISGAREATLVRRGVLAGNPDLSPRALLVDIGGGSTEFIRGTGVLSLPLGCVALLETGGPAAAGARRRSREMLQVLPEEFTRDPVRLIGLGGTFTTLAAVKLGLEPYRGEAVDGLVLEKSWIEDFLARIAPLTPPERAAIAGLPADRADIIAAGSAIALEVLEKGGYAEATISDRGILFGLLDEDRTGSDPGHA